MPQSDPKLPGGKNPGGVPPADLLRSSRRAAGCAQVAQLRPAGVQRDIGPPEEPFHPDRLEAGLQHAAVDPASRQVDEHVRDVPHRVERMKPVTPAADVGQDERDAGWRLRQCRELDRVRGFLSRPVLAPVLPDVMEHGDPVRGAPPGRSDRAAVVGSPARGELDADHSRLPAAVDFDAGRARCSSGLTQT